MISIEEFYELPREEKRELVSERRVIVDQQPVGEPPEDRVPVRILDRPLTSEIFEKLQQGRYTVSELSNDIGIRDKYVRDVINRYRHRNFSELLEGYHAVLRAKDNRGPALVFSLESIPYFARVADPTLMCSLLDVRESLSSRFKSTDWYQEGVSVELDEEYALWTADLWELDTDDTTDFIRDFERQYVDTGLGPLPVVKDDQEYEEVRYRLKEGESAYARRKGIDESTADERIGTFRERCSRSLEEVELFQSLSLTLFDLREYARREDPSIRSSIEDQIDEVIGCLDPDSAKQDDSKQRITGRGPGQSSGVGETDGEGIDWDERELLIELVALTQELGELPTETEINDRTSFSHRTYIVEFGSLLDAFRRAGIIDESVSESGGRQRRT